MGTILIAEARFYTGIADLMARSAIIEIEQAGLQFERVQVPGCFELPAAIAMAAASDTYRGYVALGCVIRGETSHYDYVCAESARGLNELAFSKKIALGYGIITAEDKSQAEERANRNGKDVGGRAAKACIAMLNLKQKWEV